MQINPAAVEASGWGWRHATRKDFALRAVDFTIRPGERVLLLGASGAGKSTMMAGLAGVLGGDEEGEQEGSLTIDGVDAREARGRVGLVLQDPDSQIILERLGDDAPSAAKTSTCRARRFGSECANHWIWWDSADSNWIGPPAICPAVSVNVSRWPACWL